MERSEIEARLIDLLVDELGLDRRRVTMDAGLEDDLDLDSLGMVELFLALERAFGVSLSDEEAERVTSVGAVVAAVAARLGG